MELGNTFFGNSRGEFSINRDWQDMFCEHLYDMGFNSYGEIKHEKLECYKVDLESVHGSTTIFENEAFVIMPYYWGDDDAISELPNFIHKPTGFEMSWYKYALRDSYMNQDLSLEELEDILIDCKHSLGIDNKNFRELVKSVESAKEFPVKVIEEIKFNREFIDGLSNEELTIFLGGLSYDMSLMGIALSIGKSVHKYEIL